MFGYICAESEEYGSPMKVAYFEIRVNAQRQRLLADLCTGIEAMHDFEVTTEVVVIEYDTFECVEVRGAGGEYLGNLLARHFNGKRRE